MVTKACTRLKGVLQETLPTINCPGAAQKATAFYKDKRRGISVIFRVLVAGHYNAFVRY